MRILSALVFLTACGGSTPEPKPAPAPPPPKPVVKEEPPPSEPPPPPEAPPAPDPREAFSLLLGALSQEAASLRQMPFEDWKTGVAGISGRDGDLQQFIGELPDEMVRIERLRKNAAELQKWIEKGKKKQAEKALKAFEADLKIETPKE